MITPLDIQNKVFAKGVRGYKEEEVDGFLDMITLDLERVLEENQKLKAQIKEQADDLQHYKGSEETVLQTLEAAKALMSDISISAEKRANILVKNAELDGELIQREAKENVERLNEEYGSLRRSLEIFTTRYRSLLEAELDKFDVLSAELFPVDTLPDWIAANSGTEHKGCHSQGMGAGNFSTDKHATIVLNTETMKEETIVMNKVDTPDSPYGTDMKTITNLRTGD